ncbi:MAG TPA: serine/threonine-protein kinase [Actinomycetota bacterium]|jgi:serine/threonine protein kinase|nr:serine/threonine-protein kinase [Actinomycetota bacterium]
MAGAHRDPGGWNLAEGEDIVPGRTAVRLLGSSRVHDVYAAWDDTWLGVVAVKLLRPDFVGDVAATRALATEADVLRRLVHPSFPRCYDEVLDSERPHLALELVEGPRLSTVIRRQGRLGVEQAIPLVLQIASAIHYLFANGMLHLDVKPKNVMMAPPPRLIDLSVARSVEAAKSTRGPVGTDRYMAPEQTGTGLASEMDHATDVWGLGATIHESLSGEPPFPDGDPSASGPARFPQLVHEPGPLPRDVPDPLAGLIRASLERRPQDRPTAAEIVHELDPLTEAIPPQPILGKVRIRAWKPRSR